MSKRKYARSTRINNMSELSKYTGDYYVIQFGKTFKTLHVGFVHSFQYRYLRNLVKSGNVYKAKRIRKNDTAISV